MMPKRRANHEGTIYKRPDGRWMASLTLPGGKRKSFYGRTRQEVAQKLTVGLKARLDGVLLPSECLTLGWHLQAWVQTTRAAYASRPGSATSNCSGVMPSHNSGFCPLPGLHHTTYSSSIPTASTAGLPHVPPVRSV